MVIKPTDNFFFAVLPDVGANSRAQVIADEKSRLLGEPGYRVPRNCRHVSIAGIGAGADITENFLAALRAGVDGLAIPTFRVSLNGFQSWPGPSRPWVLTGDEGVIGFQQLLDALRLKLNDAGFSTPWPKILRPHMTLARNGAHSEPIRIPPIHWAVTELVLVQSHVGEGRYTIAARWPFDLPEPAYPKRAA